MPLASHLSRASGRIWPGIGMDRSGTGRSGLGRISVAGIRPGRISPGRIGLMVCTLWLGGCASSLPVYEGTRPIGDTSRPGVTPAAAPAIRGDHTGAEVARQALAMLGTPYRYGGATPAGFDCSGLVQYAYQQLGLSVPRTTGEQYSSAQTVRRRNMQPGDLLFFQFTNTVSHVGIYLGDGRFVHAPTAGRTVEIMDLEQPYYRAGFIGAGRLHAQL